MVHTRSRGGSLGLAARPISPALSKDVPFELLAVRPCFCCSPATLFCHLILLGQASPALLLPSIQFQELQSQRSRPFMRLLLAC